MADHRRRGASAIEHGAPQGGERAFAHTKLLTASELAGSLRVHPSTIYRLLKSRKLPGFKVGNDWRFDIEAIHRWLEDHDVLARPLGKHHRR